MSWAIYLKFLSAGKFVLIEYLTLIYIFAYFCNAIWLFYQLIIHAGSKADNRKNIFLQFFLQFLLFSVKRPNGLSLRPDGCGSGVQTVRLHVGTRAACRMLIWQRSSGRVNDRPNKDSTGYKSSFYPSLRHIIFFFTHFSLTFSFCLFERLYHGLVHILGVLCPFVLISLHSRHFLCSFYSFQCFIHC